MNALLEDISTVPIFKEQTLDSNNLITRAGCRDIWNAKISEGAVFGKYDIPYCPTTATVIPADQITWDEAKAIHRKNIAIGDKNYYVDAFVNWYIDDYKFDGPRGIWSDCNNALTIVKHFAGLITPDFSTYQDFPVPIKLYAVYRMRLLGLYFGKQGCQVVNNVRWGTEETYDYCFEGIPKNSIVSIGTVGGSPKKLADRARFEKGIHKMVEVLSPHTVLIYGSAKAPCFDQLREQGINVVQYPSRTSKVFERRKLHEQGK